MDLEIVLHPENAGWVIEKIARRLRDELTAIGYSVVLGSSFTGQGHKTLWMHYMHVPTRSLIEPESDHYFLVTHVDDQKKLSTVKRLCSLGMTPIAISRDTAQKLSRVLRFPKDISSIRIGSDLAKPESTTFNVAMCSRVYADGRKNEGWLTKFPSSIDLSDVSFTLVGSGWESTAESLRSRAKFVSLEDESSVGNDSYVKTLEALTKSNLVIYTGFDEGALSALDANLLSCDLLISNQGFHMEFGLGEENLFNNQRDFYTKFEIRLDRWRAKKDLFESWSWQSMAKQFEKIIFNNKEEIISQLSDQNFNIIERYCFIFRLTVVRLKRLWKHSLYLAANRMNGK